MGESVVLHSFDPNWANLFAQERSAIAVALNISEDRISHVGSTAVPGLAAKAIIDILVEIMDYPPDASAI